MVKTIWACAYIQEPASIQEEGGKTHYLMAWSLVAEVSATNQTLEIKAFRDKRNNPCFVFEIHPNSVVSTMKKQDIHYQSQHLVKAPLTIGSLAEILQKASYPAPETNTNKNRLALLEAALAELKNLKKIDTDGKKDFFEKVKAGCWVPSGGSDLFTKAK